MHHHPSHCRERMLRFPIAARVLTALVLASRLPAQPHVQLPLTEQFTMRSSTNGVEYRIDVSLPQGLDTMRVRPSVFYLTDGNPFFPVAREVWNVLSLGGGTPPLIIVGVSYPESDGPGFTPGYVVHRTRDYTPTDIGEMAGGGGAARYLAFLKDELIPLVERRYRADSTQRGLGGHSLGGLFATYALAHEPGLFRRYWIGSPSLWWDKQVAFSWLPSLQQRAAAVTGRAFVTVGALETEVMVPPAQRLAQALTRGFPRLRTGSQVFPDETHASVIGGALTRAFRFLYTAYGQSTIAYAPAVHGSFAGTWVTADRRELTIRPRPGGLQLVMSDAGNVLRANLLASARDSLFTRELPIVLAATRDAQGRVQRLSTSMGGIPLEYSRKP